MQAAQNILKVKKKEGFNMLKDTKLEEYIELVDSQEATPGGGSVAALVGALGAALNRMLAHLSLSKKKFLEASESQKEIFVTAANEIKQYKEALIDGIDGDALSYQCVMTAFKLKDEVEIQRALNTSAFIALDIQKNAFLALQRVKELIPLGNKNVMSDLVAGTILLQSCIEISYLNVKANAKMLKDLTQQQEFLSEGQNYIQEGLKLKEIIINQVHL